MPVILVTGSNGFVGQHIIKKLLASMRHVVIASAKGENRSPFGVSSVYQYHSLDICIAEEVDKLFFTVKPDVVIHTAALSQPDYCALNEAECYRVNIQGTKNIIAASEKNNAYLLFTSTDFVFNGNGGPYDEDDFVDPVNYYGWSKAEGERFVQQSGLTHCIVRLCSVYGKPVSGTNRNVVMLVKEKLTNHEYVKMVNDQLRTPTSVEDVAAAVIALVEKSLEGVYHISGTETLTPYDMAIKTAAFFKLDKSLIKKTLTSFFVQPARRPLVTGFKIEKAINDIAFKPIEFDAALEKMFRNV